MAAGDFHGVLKMYAGQRHRGRPPTTRALPGATEADKHANCCSDLSSPSSAHQPKIQAKMSGATIVASDSTMYLGVSCESLPHVIFSLGTAPE